MHENGQDIAPMPDSVGEKTKGQLGLLKEEIFRGRNYAVITRDQGGQGNLKVYEEGGGNNYSYKYTLTPGEHVIGTGRHKIDKISSAAEPHLYIEVAFQQDGELRKGWVSSKYLEEKGNNSEPTPPSLPVVHTERGNGGKIEEDHRPIAEVTPVPPIPSARPLTLRQTPISKSTPVSASRELPYDSPQSIQYPVRGNGPRLLRRLGNLFSGNPEQYQSITAYSSYNRNANSRRENLSVQTYNQRELTPSGLGQEFLLHNGELLFDARGVTPGITGKTLPDFVDIGPAQCFSDIANRDEVAKLLKSDIGTMGSQDDYPRTIQAMYNFAHNLGGSKQEKIRRIYDHVMERLQYRRGDERAHTGVDVYKNRTGMCNGYASVFVLLLSFAGVENVRHVSGMAESQLGNGEWGSHAWVKIDGLNYDPTFDDTRSDSPTHEFFGIRDENLQGRRGVTFTFQ